LARSLWNGVISFGMVSIPVKLFTATESKDVSFHLLHRICNSRLKQLRWCPICDREVEWAEIVRGYEYGKEQHIVFSEEDFASLPVASKHTVEVSAFVKAEEIDPVFYEKSYYVEPDDIGAKPFALLLQALETKGLTAIAKIAVREKERLCALRLMDGTLMLETLFYADEIRVEKGKEMPATRAGEREMAMALTLIDLLTEEFEPEKYQDEYRIAVTAAIEAKLEGKELEEAAPPPPAKVTDLMAALRASVEAAKKRKGEEPEAAEASSGRRRRAAAG